MGCGASSKSEKAYTISAQPKKEPEKKTESEKTPPRPEITLIAKADAESISVFDRRFVVPDGKPCMLHLKKNVLDPNGDEEDHRIEDLNGSGLCFQVGEVHDENTPKRVSDGAGVPVYSVVTLGPWAMIAEYDANGQLVEGKARLKVSAAARQAKDNIVTYNAWCSDLTNNRGDAIELNSNFECEDKFARPGGGHYPSLDGGLWLGKADPSQAAIAKVSNAAGSRTWPLFEQFPDAGLNQICHVLEIPPGADAALMLAFVLAAMECHRSMKTGGVVAPSSKP